MLRLVGFILGDTGKTAAGFVTTTDPKGDEKGKGLKLKLKLGGQRDGRTQADNHTSRHIQRQSDTRTEGTSSHVRMPMLVVTCCCIVRRIGGNDVDDILGIKPKLSRLFE